MCVCVCAPARACLCARTGEDEGPSVAGVGAGTSVVSLDENVSLSFLAPEAARAWVHLFLIVSWERPRTGVCVRTSVWSLQVLGGARVSLRVSACAYLCECVTALVCVLDFHECCVFKDLYCVGACVLRKQECVLSLCL